MARQKWVSTIFFVLTFAVPFGSATPWSFPESDIDPSPRGDDPITSSLDRRESVTARAMDDVPSCEDMPEGGNTPVEVGTSSCDNTDALSGVPYNVFSSQNNSVYGIFCHKFDPNKLTYWTADQHGQQRNPTPSKVKRTPPPNPTAYGDFNFNLKWEPQGTLTQECAQPVESCLNAFDSLANSPCGHQGGEQNIMTSAGKFEIPNCGTYSYSITGLRVPAPAAPKPPPPPPPSLGSQQCNSAPEVHDDIHKALQAEGAEKACAHVDGHIIKDGDPSTNIRYVQIDWGTSLLYIYEVYWTKDCKSLVTEMDVGESLANDFDSTCADLLKNAYLNCNNGGIGGSISVGCLTFAFSVK